MTAGALVCLAGLAATSCSDGSTPPFATMCVTLEGEVTGPGGTAVERATVTARLSEPDAGGRAVEERVVGTTADGSYRLVIETADVGLRAGRLQVQAVPLPGSGLGVAEVVREVPVAADCPAPPIRVDLELPAQVTTLDHATTSPATGRAA